MQGSEAGGWFQGTQSKNLSSDDLSLLRSHTTVMLRTGDYNGSGKLASRLDMKPNPQPSTLTATPRPVLSAEDRDSQLHALTFTLPQEA